MVDFETLPNGEIDDRVRVIFKGFAVRTFENYTVKIAVLQQPAVFSVRLGSVEPAKDILARYQPGTQFQLAIGPQPAFTGFVDGQESLGDGNSSTVVISGRDILARLQDAEFGADKSFVNVTLADLVYEVMVEAGGLGEQALISSNDANVIIRSGDGVTKKPGTPAKPLSLGGGSSPAGSINDLIVATSEGAKTGAFIPGTASTYTVHAKMGDRCLDFIKKHLDKAGLMLWTDTNGDIVVSAPNILQPPRYSFIRQRGQARNVVNVLSHDFKNDTTKRCSKVVVYGRGPGRKAGKGKIRGEFVDEEMVAAGILKTRSFRDVNVLDEAQAVKYARAKLSEINRGSWHLTYKIKGHTAPLVGGGRGIITPDTVAQIQDDDLGLSGLFYVEAVEYSSPATTTSITFMRLQDCFFEKDPTIVEQVERANTGHKRRRRRKS
jgi:prophage tail gpP-like protein